METINHPRHYNAHPSGVEAIAICEWLTFNVGNAVKYVWRAELKGDRVECLRKAAWYLRRVIERDEDPSDVPLEVLSLVDRVVDSDSNALLGQVLGELILRDADIDERLHAALSLVEGAIT